MFVLLFSEFSINNLIQDRPKKYELVVSQVDLCKSSRSREKKSSFGFFEKLTFKLSVG